MKTGQLRLTSGGVGWEAHAGSNALVNRYQSCLGMSPVGGRRIFEKSISKIIFSRYFSFGKSKMLPKWYQMGEVMLWRVHGTLGKVPGTFSEDYGKSTGFCKDFGKKWTQSLDGRLGGPRGPREVAKASPSILL